ncbi:hypothetical protein BDV40DRAFT_274769 [Aspergillus tamarii]|uniref:Uncharacterized protein n=1 Tax=Aspergillus tamarii TaxID=41984 RepID=A0A5N6UK30_ASPTM|nr:hypothetical protein BDV40DRAFT_274769 [Aspergillus tamarii]
MIRQKVSSVPGGCTLYIILMFIMLPMLETLGNNRKGCHFDLCLACKSSREK